MSTRTRREPPGQSSDGSGVQAHPQKRRKTTSVVDVIDKLSNGGEAAQQSIIALYHKSVDNPAHVYSSLCASKNGLQAIVDLLGSAGWAVPALLENVLHRDVVDNDFKDAIVAAGAVEKLQEIVVEGAEYSLDHDSNWAAAHAAGALGALVVDRVDLVSEFFLEDVRALIRLLHFDPASETVEKAARALVNLVNSGHSLVEYNIMDSLDTSRHPAAEWLSDGMLANLLRPCDGSAFAELLGALQVKSDDFVHEGERFRHVFGVPTALSQERLRLRTAMETLDEFSGQMPDEAYRRIANALAGRNP